MSEEAVINAWGDWVHGEPGECDACGGTGGGMSPMGCPHCDGTGQSREARRRAEDERAEAMADREAWL